MNKDENTDFTERPGILEADLDLPEHRRAVVEIMDRYAADPMGDGKPLSETVKQRLAPGLQNHPGTLIFLAMDSREPVGVAVCFFGYSTFKAKPLISISDYFVRPEVRGRGIGRGLLLAVEKKALETGCCKLTLEVQEFNRRARRVYGAFGFSQSVYTEEAGGALHLSKPLD